MRSNMKSKCLILDTGVLAHEHDTCYERGDHSVCSSFLF